MIDSVKIDFLNDLLSTLDNDQVRKKIDHVLNCFKNDFKQEDTIEFILHFIARTQIDALVERYGGKWKNTYSDKELLLSGPHVKKDTKFLVKSLDMPNRSAEVWIGELDENRPSGVFTCNGKAFFDFIVLGS